MVNSFGARGRLDLGSNSGPEIYRLDALEKQGLAVGRLPFAMKILLENLLRHEDGKFVGADDVRRVAEWQPKAKAQHEISFMPARVLLQDFTGVPAVADLAALRDAMRQRGGPPNAINPLQPVELVIDHSVQVDAFGSGNAFAINADLEFSRNRERYLFLRWGQQAFANFRVVPPDTGIVHQVNLEYLARVVMRARVNGGDIAYPDTLVGTDSHTPMVNGLGVVGWGVGGIEAEAAMLGQPISMLLPEVVGVRLSGALAPGATATDLVLTVTERLRKKGVVGKFVEFFGEGVSALSVADRATLGNMSPEYGATIAIFPIDEATLRYLRFTNRSPERVRLVERYAKEQGLFGSTTSAESYTDVLDLDLSAIEPSLAGPKRPQDRVPLGRASSMFTEALPGMLAAGKTATTSPNGHVNVEIENQRMELHHGSVVIAAITSCTNTSNPSVMIAAGLLARKAVERGLATRPWVKTSLAPGSKVVTDYLKEAGLLPYLEKLRFNLVGYGCTTCIGNSGPLPEPVASAIEKGKLVAAAVLSGNRNFEGRIHPLVRANYLASPPLVVAYALAGDMNLNIAEQPLGNDREGKPVYLREIWPSPEEVNRAVESFITPAMFAQEYGEVFEGDGNWKSLPAGSGELFDWQAESTYVRLPPFLDAEFCASPGEIVGARVLALLGDSVTTDHISPAGNIPANSPAGHYLIKRGVKPADFNSYGARRGNHEVMVRGTFANVRLRNFLAPGTEGGWTRHLPSGEVTSIYEAAMKYEAEGVPCIVIAGAEYGSGSSRDWAAKGPRLLGVRAVIARSYERIHRSNLIGMGIVPLQFVDGESAASLRLSGEETFDIRGLERLQPGAEIEVAASRDGQTRSFRTVARVDTPMELAYLHAGGILCYVLGQLHGAREGALAKIEELPV
jgi:aconitate hydratase